jgi:hypothetical protein
MAPVKRDGAKTPPELPDPKVNEVASGLRKIRRKSRKKGARPWSTSSRKIKPDPKI